MPDPAYYLTEDDRDFLVWLRERFQRERQTEVRPETRNPRSRTPYQPPLEATHPGPKCYVALTPSGGIPALNPYSTTGTGTTSFDDDEPGEAECDVYRIDETPGTTGHALLTRIPGLTKTVYNISTTEVNGHEWVKVHRTEGGQWVVDKPAGTGGGGGGGPLAITNWTGSGTINAGTTTTFTAALSLNADIHGAGVYQIIGQLVFVSAVGTYGVNIQITETTGNINGSLLRVPTIEAQSGASAFTRTTVPVCWTFRADSGSFSWDVAVGAFGSNTILDPGTVGVSGTQLLLHKLSSI